MPLEQRSRAARRRASEPHRRVAAPSRCGEAVRARHEQFAPDRHRNPLRPPELRQQRSGHPSGCVSWSGSAEAPGVPRAHLLTENRSRFTAGRPRRYAVLPISERWTACTPTCRSTRCSSSSRARSRRACRRSRLAAHQGHPFTPGVPVATRDRTRRTAKVRPSLDTPHEVNELFASHCMIALGIYVCATYGGLQTPKRVTGGLSAWQERAAKDMIEGHLEGGIALEDLAALCGLSASRFAHAFKSSTGVAPHRWLLQRRIERAKALLIHSARDTCRHRAELRLRRPKPPHPHIQAGVGASPGEWRKSLQ